MPSLKFNFLHPVKGRACLSRLCGDTYTAQQILVDSEGKKDFEVALGPCDDGRYRFILNWEYENRQFTHLTEFVIRAQELLLYQD
ncbi:hypothetical protein [Mucilaginibacter sp.]|jgi:hypothetical protein|uniref:hypothetical protein n=1 Tax=Mucilaginibacter sp. TaxID=1882438 RepID=UPI0025E2A711|nr:hypothetical protein [Mucilaginibacter sp.]